MQRPRNLLILMADELRRDALGAMGHPLVQTPRLDALVARGRRFLNSVTPSPMCVPARAAFATGRPVHQTGHWDSATPYAGDPAGWVHALREAGVHTTAIGKLHHLAGSDAGYAEEILPMQVAGDGWTIGLLRENPPEYAATAELAAETGTGESSYTSYDRAVTEAAVTWLSSQAPRRAPWMTFVSLVSPHYPLTCPEAFASLYPLERMPLPTGHGAPPPDHPELRRLRAFYDYDRHFDADRARAAVASYLGLVSFLDDCVGRVLAALEASGQFEDTLVIFTSDHGEMLGDHGFWTKQVMYEGSVGVPLLVAGPGIAPDRIDTPASLLDIAATARGWFGLPRDAEAPGADLRGLPRSDAERTVFSEYHDGGSTTAAFMVRWDRWKYVAYVGAPPQLFDLGADPQEARDLGTDPAFAAIRAEGARRLRAVCDPEAVNARAFADQGARITALGGADAILSQPAFGHTPTPLG